VISAARGAWRQEFKRDLFCRRGSPKFGDLGRCALAFTIAPHLQTINYTVAFRRLSAFDRVRQGSIKVDGTFA